MLCEAGKPRDKPQTYSAACPFGSPFRCWLLIEPSYEWHTPAVYPYLLPRGLRHSVRASGTHDRHIRLDSFCQSEISPYSVPLLSREREGVDVRPHYSSWSLRRILAVHLHTGLALYKSESRRVKTFRHAATTSSCNSLSFALLISWYCIVC